MDESYTHHTEVDVRFRDIDPFKHVNNAVVITYIEQARTECLMDLLDIETIDDVNFILADIHCAYRAPTFLGETVVIGTRVGTLGQKSFELEYRLEEKQSGRLIAEAETTQVFYDYETEETIPVPDAFRRAVEDEKS